MSLVTKHKHSFYTIFVRLTEFQFSCQQNFLSFLWLWASLCLMLITQLQSLHFKCTQTFSSHLSFFCWVADYSSDLLSPHIVQQGRESGHCLDSLAPQRMDALDSQALCSLELHEEPNEAFIYLFIFKTKEAQASQLLHKIQF